MTWPALFHLAARLPSRAVLLCLRFYQVALSPLKAALFGQPACCRFYPTCSQYAVDAIRTRGLIVGGWLAVKRIGKCHPFHRGGFDPVPLAGCRPVADLQPGKRRSVAR